MKGENVIYPSLAFGWQNENGALVFTLVAPDYFPSAAFVKVGEDGTSAVHIAANGAAPDDGFSGYVQYSGGNVGRWADYSAAVSDGDSVWLATEYIPNLPRTSLANWGTSIIKLNPWSIANPASGVACRVRPATGHSCVLLRLQLVLPLERGVRDRRRQLLQFAAHLSSGSPH